MTAHHPPLHKNASTATSSSQSSTNIVGVHYRVGKKLGEGSFGVLYEGEFSCDKYRDQLTNLVTRAQFIE
jgi:hypothetical protein